MKLTTLILAAALTAGTAAMAVAAQPAQHYTAVLQPLNDSGVTGTVALTLDGDQLTVTVDAAGLEAGMLHPQHIHGQDHRNATCPDAAADTNGDGWVDVNEGAPFYGAVKLALEPFPTADAAGEVHFQETFTVDPAGFRPLQSQTVVLHGMTVDGTYEATLPVACAQIMPATPHSQHGQGGGRP